MNKNVTPLELTPKQVKKTKTVQKELKPSDKVVQDILQYAATYRVEKIKNDILIEYCLN